VLGTYDFVVVGGGSAGAVVANRLSEVNGWTVLLLEAGGDETEVSDVPSLAGYLQLTEMDWQYKTLPPGKFSLSLSYSNRGRKRREGFYLELRLTGCGWKSLDKGKAGLTCTPCQLISTFRTEIL